MADPIVTSTPSRPYEGVPKTLGQGDKEITIVNTLEGYRQEAVNNRMTGPNPRDEKWNKNVDLYWNRYDFSGKAEWQAKETMPEVPSYVDRFAAAMKEALVATPDQFYDVFDPKDTEHDLTDAIKRMTDVWLDMTGQNQMGQVLGFSTVFEEQMKMGAIMATSAVTTWKDDVEGGRVAVETVDPRNLWLDATGRNLYRIRRIELDKHDLIGMANAVNKKGQPVYNLEALEQLIADHGLREMALREELAGHGNAVMGTPRIPIVLDEYLATVLDYDGTILSDKGLMVVANQKFLIRGPEKNPFWHGQDWVSFAPLITAPLSVYGRSYMEDFGSIAKTFTELTNLILDAVYTSSLNAFAIVPGMLLNPAQANEGISPNKVFLLDEAFKASEFAADLSLGSLDPGAVQVWQNMKAELSEAAGINEIGLGQFAPNSRTSATEIMETQQSSSAMIRSVAQTVETRFLDPTLNLIWKTGVQHVSKKNQALREAAGPEMFDALMANRKELVSRPVTFRARGISGLIQRNHMFSSLMQVLQIIAQDENLLGAFMQKVDVNKLLRLIFDLSGIDMRKISTSQRDQMMQDLMGPINARVNAQAEASPQAQQEMGDVAARMGVAR